MADSSTARTPEKVAILGGGLGSLVTALELTRPGVNEGKYQVTIFQMGHRLGGKGASGRNAHVHQRNEEHGLHVWLGFYENAFRLMREVLEEWSIPNTHPWAAPQPEDRWRNAFHAHSYAPLTERRNNQWNLWNLKFPLRNNGEPGDGQGADEDLWELMGRLRAFLLKIFKIDSEVFGTGASHRLEAPLLAQLVLESPMAIGAPNAFSRFRLLELSTRGMNLSRLELLSHASEPLRRLGLVLNLGWALLRGLTRNYTDITRDTLDVLDAQEFRQFLKDHGASNETVQSPLTSALYDAIFAWEGGDPNRERLAAGAGIRCLLRIFFSYKHALSWKMQAGMGDTIFTPMYDVLKARGVEFKFFHEVKALHLSRDGRSIEQIVIDRQVTLTGGMTTYPPFVNVNGLDCWPSEPSWQYIVEAAQIQAGGHNLEHANNGWNAVERLTLDRGAKDGFDQVVLGISLAAIPAIAPELLAASARFARMTREVQTVRTQAWQAWLNTDAAGLGWPHGPPVLSNYLDPLNTWADMSFLLPREQNPAEVESVHYFCGPMLDSVPPQQAPQHVAQNVAALQQELAGSLWPGALHHGAFNQALIEHQYRRANTNPSDRYVLTLPGTTESRLRAGDSGFENLTLAGDWTRNQFNVGCVEATVMSGRLASQAISGRPTNNEIAYSSGP